MNIKEALDKFIVQLEADGRSRNTILQYTRHIRLFARWAAQVGHSGNISDISHEVIARFLSSPQARTRPDGGLMKSSSVNAIRSSLKGFFSYLHLGGFTTTNPGRMIRRAICGPPPPKALNHEEQRRLLDVLAKAEGKAGRRDHLLFHLMLSTGTRLSTTLGIDVEDVDLSRGEIQLRSMKGDRFERVFLNPKISTHLQDFISTKSEGPLFQNYFNQRLSYRQAHRRFSQWRDKAGIPRSASSHSLRHSFASNLYQKSHDVLLVKAALHHRSIKSTLVYTKPDEERLRRVLQA